jgi:CRP/FNR family cyclic AMP-dependent transcriptional regulator
MSTILSYCAGQQRWAFDAGDLLLEEGKTSGRLYVLCEGTVEVLRGATQVAAVSEPGAVFGEMSIVLGVPHTATVRAVTSGYAYVFENADAFLRSHPEIAFLIARLLATRLNAATTYLVDLKRQFAGHDDHFGMVGEVLESLMHHQDEAVSPGSDRQPDPRM